MQRCINLAKNGLGTTYPNPLVGAILVFENKIIGEGWHKKSGEAHAEVIAIESVKNKELISKATLYVSLEPCCHYGKTPPCANLIIEKKIKKVIIGCVDFNEKVAGKGIELLINNGVEVIQGVLNQDCIYLNKRFFTFHTQKKPYIILKWAQSFDEFIAPIKNDSLKPIMISNLVSQQLVHKWRTQEEGILVGTKTVLIDNPKLTARNWQGNNPKRIILDKNNQISKESYIFDNQSETIYITSNEIDFSENWPINICKYLYNKQIQSVIIEGGTKTLQGFIDANLWNEARIFTNKSNLKSGIKAPNITGKIKKIEIIANDHLKILIPND